MLLCESSMPASGRSSRTLDGGNSSKCGFTGGAFFKGDKQGEINLKLECVVVIVVRSRMYNSRPDLLRCINRRGNSLNASNFTESTGKVGCVDIPVLCCSICL